MMWMIVLGIAVTPVQLDAIGHDILESTSIELLAPRCFLDPAPVRQHIQHVLAPLPSALAAQVMTLHQLVEDQYRPQAGDPLDCNVFGQRYRRIVESQGPVVPVVPVEGTPIAWRDIGLKANPDPFRHDAMTSVWH